MQRFVCAAKYATVWLYSLMFVFARLPLRLLCACLRLIGSATDSDSNSDTDSAAASTTASAMAGDAASVAVSLYLCLQIKFQLSISIHYKPALALKPHFKPRQRKLRIRSAKQTRRCQVAAKPVICVYVCVCVYTVTHIPQHSLNTHPYPHTRTYLKAAAKLIVIDTYWTADAD